MDVDKAGSDPAFALLPQEAEVSIAPEAVPSKRIQILEGARQIFRSRGFDGASMGDIAKAARVSKGTLYVYFDSKEALFEALVLEDRRNAVERMTALDAADPDVRAALGEYGRAFLAMMVKPDHISMVRMVMGAAEKFPEIGRVFYEAGPAFGVRYLADYLERQAAAGRLRISDPELAASHFIDLCKGITLRPLFFGVAAAPSPEAIEHAVEAALSVFFAAYGPKARS